MLARSPVFYVAIIFAISAVIADSNFQISPGFRHSMFLNDGSVYVVGGGDPQLCANTTQNLLAITEISSDLFQPQLNQAEIVTRISAGSRMSLMLTSDGNVYSCGSNTYHGLPVSEHVLVPTRIESSTFVPPLESGVKLVQAFASENHAILRTSDNKLYVFGAGGDYLGLGPNPGTKQSPTLIQTYNPELGNAKIVDVFAARFHSIMLTSEGEIYTWGNSFGGRLGRQTGPENPSSIPTKVTQFAPALGAGVKIAQIAGLSTNTMVLTTANELYTCGEAGNGRLGNSGATGDIETLTKVTQFSPYLPNGVRIRNIVGGVDNSRHTLLRTSDGNVYGFGSGSSGRLGRGGNSDQDLPTLIERHRYNPLLDENDYIRIVAAGSAYSMVVTNSGHIYSFGDGWSGRLGTGNENNLNVPTKIELPFNITFPPPAPEVTAMFEVRLDTNPSTFSSTGFRDGVASTAGVRTGRVVIASVRPGSTIVTFYIASGPEDEISSRNAAEFLLQILSTNLTLFEENISYTVLSYNVFYVSVANIACESGSFPDANNEGEWCTGAANCTYDEVYANATGIPIAINNVRFLPGGFIYLELRHPLTSGRTVTALEMSQQSDCNYPGNYWIKGVKEDEDQVECEDFYLFVMPWTMMYQSDDASAGCGLVRDDTDPDTLWFDGVLSVYYDDTIDVEIIGEVTRSSKFMYPFRLGFPKYVTANISVVVFNNPNLLYAVVQQKYDATTSHLTLQVVTTVRAPFILKDAIAQVPNGVTIVSQAILSSDCNATDVNSICEQIWEFIVSTTDCTFDGAYNLNVNLSCKDAVGDCPIEGNESDVLGFTIESGDICVIVTDIAGVSAELTAYASYHPDNNEFLNAKSAFFASQEIVFKLEITSDSGFSFEDSDVLNVTIDDANGNPVSMLPTSPASAELSILNVPSEADEIVYLITFKIDEDWFGTFSSITTTTIRVECSVTFQDTDELLKRSIASNTKLLTSTSSFKVINSKKDKIDTKEKNNKNDIPAASTNESNALLVVTVTLGGVVALLVIGLVVILAVIMKRRYMGYQTVDKNHY